MVTEAWNCFCPPAATIADAGEIVTTGIGAFIVKLTPPDVPPPGGGVETVTVAVLAVPMSTVLMAACNVVLETKVVVRLLPFH